MTESTYRRSYYSLLVLLLLGSNLILLTGLPIGTGVVRAIWSRFAAAYFLTTLLPGYLLGVIWLAGRRMPLLQPIERTVFMLALGYASAIFLSLLLSYVPGPLESWQVQAGYSVLCAFLIGLAAVMERYGQTEHTTKLPHSATSTNPHGAVRPFHDSAVRPFHDGAVRPFHDQRDNLTMHGLPSPRWQVAAIISVLAVATLLRLPSIGYSEFQYDEVNVLIQATEAIEGRPDALLVHDKGPGEILLFATTYSLVGRTSEALARLPFAIANMAAVVALMILGWRMFGAVAGWVAALMMTVDGYFIGFSQIVQYQNLVALMAILAVLAAYLYCSQRDASIVQFTSNWRPDAGTLWVPLVGSARSIGYLILAAFLLAAGVLAHYEAILAALPMAYFFGMQIRSQGSRLQWWAWLSAAITFAVLTGLFYVPFAAHPRFAHTFAEITGNRIGAQFPYNNLNDFFTRTLVYSSTYYFALIILALWVAWIQLIYRGSNAWRTWAGIALCTAGLILVFINPSWFTLLNNDQTWIFFMLLIAIAIIYAAGRHEEQAVWIWFGLPFIAAIFFVQKPRTHVYNFFIPWALLLGVVAERWWHILRRTLPDRFASATGIAVALALTGLFANYEYWMFTYTNVEVLRTWSNNRPPGYWFPFDTISQNAIFGFPFKNGWKVVGSLYAQGELDGPLDRNGERGVTQWYTRGGVDCARDARYFVYTKWKEPVNKGLTEVTPRPTEEQGYWLRHVVRVNGEIRLEIFDRLASAAPVQYHDVSDYESIFDRNISGPDMHRDGPVFKPAIQNPTRYRFGEHIELLGYTVNDTSVMPGHQLDVTLYWRTDKPLDISYKVFNQIINLDNLHKAGQRDGIPGCERYATDTWSPGHIIADRYSIWIAPDAPPGSYTHLLGMYDAQEERLPLFDATNQHIGDALSLYEVNVIR